MNFKLTILFLLSSTLLRAGDWPRWLGPDGTGVSTESGWKNNLEEQAWKSKVGVGFSSVSVADGRVYTMGHDGKKSDGKETVYCLDAKTGKMVWTHSYPAPLIDYLHEGGPCSTPTVDGSTNLRLEQARYFACLWAEDGKIPLEKGNDEGSRYEKASLEWGFAASPYPLGDLSHRGRTFALDKKQARPNGRARPTGPPTVPLLPLRTGRPT